MADATYEGYARAQLANLVSIMDQPYEMAAEDLQRGESLYARFMDAERERHRREMDAWRAEFERGYLRPTRHAMTDVLELLPIRLDRRRRNRLQRGSFGRPLE